MIGWFLIWGGLYSLYILLVLIIFLLLWAFIEEKYILEKKFITLPLYPCLDKSLAAPIVISLSAIYP